MRVTRAATPAMALTATAAAVSWWPLAGRLFKTGDKPPFADLAQLTFSAGCTDPHAGVIGFAGCDPYGRAYNYPTWWRTVTHAAGVTGGDTWWLGLLLALVALIAVTLVLRRLDLSNRGLLLAAAVMVSPPWLLMVARASTDLAVAALLGAAILTAVSLRHRAITPWLLAAATVLKLYPLGAVVGLLPNRRLFWTATAASGAAVLTSVASLAAIRAATPSVTDSSFGAGVLPATLLHHGGTVTTLDQLIGAVAVAVLAATVLAVPRTRRALRAAAASLQSNVVTGSAASIGAGVFATTYLLTTSFDYRLYPLTFLAAALAATRTTPGRRLVLGLTLPAMWLTGPSRGLQPLGDLAVTALAVLVIAGIALAAYDMRHQWLTGAVQIDQTTARTDSSPVSRASASR